MKKFDIPDHYKSPIISEIKSKRKIDDPRNKDYTPSEWEFGNVKFYIARHFGFCFGVEHAIETAYKIIEENKGKRIFLLSEMIHNPLVNADLSDRGVKFVMDTKGNKLVDWDDITSDDIVIIPAFGTTTEIEELLKRKGIDTVKYNTTCPFVEKVWKKAGALGGDNYTVVIHGKHDHEETRATFSRSNLSAPSVIVRDIEETKILCDIISCKIEAAEFYQLFKGKYSDGFDVEKDLIRVGVVNQTTMLASETEAIAELIKSTMINKYGDKNPAGHFADTRDTLCYATNNNQKATSNLLNTDADFAVVIGGYNSSNTTHLAELLECKFNTYFISGPDKIISEDEIMHFDIHTKEEVVTKNYLPQKDKIKIAVTSGASCPDSVVDDVLRKFINGPRT